MAKATLQDPRTRGAKPPFPQQPIAAPGKERELNPPADHGEAGYRSAGRLEGRVALVTGGDSGIGRAVALLYAQEGASIAINSLPDDAEDAHKTVALVKKLGGRASAILGDVSDPAFCSSLVEKTVAEFGGLDILINNAAYQRSYSTVEEIPLAEIQTTFQTNVFPVFYLTQAALPHLRPGASVINTSSIQALKPSPNLVFYAATKAAISSMTKSLAGLLADRGIRVNAVAPGPVWTPLIPSTLEPDHVKKFGGHTAFKRPAQPVEQATVFVFLASDDASYVTGEVYGATGGQTPI
ncbi:MULTISPECIES: SDR family oxidoreductase [Hydrocarboniphaga]|uniref:Short-chain dehydrogenase/reductase SDR n=1 Tax=Hydrocarboniphaga effusa AP103 TaxID=1172194 RepID=I7ZJE0_9GAMM|nr:MULTISPECIES: SDR family oxidoreductase [Hydrocarboniphaga]EIT71887.1 short-chain dehydrogenase/reductase SDR [Hydrocarboniphaga effusa AP103]MDZ4077413.1 SDR family oxidoreductase [Hydrocarboniphaga sp.]